MVLEVRVQPRARRNSIEVVEGPKVRVSVTAPPEGGKANDAVTALLARALGVAKGSVTIVRGHKGRDKLLCIEGMTAQEALARLSARYGRAVGPP